MKCIPNVWLGIMECTVYAVRILSQGTVFESVAQVSMGYSTLSLHFCLSVFLQVSILYFAKSAELTGLKSETVKLPPQLTTAQLWQELESRHSK